MAFSTADKWFDSLWDFPIFFKHSFIPIVDFFVFPVQKISSLQYTCIRLQHSYPDLQIKIVYTVLLVLILQDPHFILLFHGICQMNLRYIYIYIGDFFFSSVYGKHSYGLEPFSMFIDYFHIREFQTKCLCKQKCLINIFKNFLPVLYLLSSSLIFSLIFKTLWIF